MQVALWFPMQDEGAVISGLLRADGSRKPSFAAMRDYAHDGDQLSEPCGVFTGPAIRVLSPANHVTYSGPLPIHVTAPSTRRACSASRLEIDGKLIRNYDGNRLPRARSPGVLDWQGAKHISSGRHTLTFLAYDKERNISQTSIMVYHRQRPASSAAGTPSARRQARPQAPARRRDTASRAPRR